MRPADVSESAPPPVAGTTRSGVCDASQMAGSGHGYRHGDRRRELGHTGSLVSVNARPSQEGNGRATLLRGPVAAGPDLPVVVGWGRGRLSARTLRASQR